LEFRQLLPEPATVTIGELLSSLDSLPAPELRPYVLVNFIASVDGRATFQGRSGQFGGEADRQLFRGLREHVDAVIAGTQTLRIERYGRMLREPERRRRRLERGLSPEPLTCIVTRTGMLPLDIPLFAEPDARLVIFAAQELDLGSTAAQAELVHLPGESMTLTTVLERLRADFGVASLLCEGGPSLFGSLLHEMLVDELFLTLAPKLSGGGPAMPISIGPELPMLRDLSPRWVLENDAYLFLRYALR
jgi:riboflavin biosynthesis pyrimidine reductase